MSPAEEPPPANNNPFVWPPPPVPEGVRVIRDIEYARVDTFDGKRPLHLDIYLPLKEPSRPLPLIFYVHGGGWCLFSKEYCQQSYMAAQGYVVASASYRFSQAATFPAQTHDNKGALRWLRAHAEEYHIDPTRVGAAGGSAGGHLASLLGTTAGIAELEGTTGGHFDQPSNVQAVCDICGPSDFLRNPVTEQGKDPDGPDTMVARLLGGPPQKVRANAILASPIAHVTGNEPPFLILHGDSDDLVPVQQSEMFHDALKRAGVNSTLRVIPGAGHAFAGPEIDAMITAFFDKHLRGV